MRADTILSLPETLAHSDARTVRFEYDLRSATAQEGALGLPPDAFDLPAEGWTPALPQARGLFGFGGVPPNQMAACGPRAERVPRPCQRRQGKTLREKR